MPISKIKLTKLRDSLVSLRGEADAIPFYHKIATHPSGARNDSQREAFHRKSLNLGAI